MPATQDLDSLVEALHSAVDSATQITERQHIERLQRFFDEKGNPIVMEFNCPSQTHPGEMAIVKVPLICLSPLNSIVIEELEIEMRVKMDKILNGHGQNGDKKSISIDSVSWLPSGKEKMLLKVKFKSKEVPEGFSRLVDNFIKII